MKRDNRKETLRKIQELQFAALDLNLFLDTHPGNQQAVMDFNVLSQKLREQINLYEMNFGPLTNFGYSPSNYPWAWIKEPWPWEDV